MPTNIPHGKKANEFSFPFLFPFIYSTPTHSSPAKWKIPNLNNT